MLSTVGESIDCLFSAKGPYELKKTLENAIL